MTGNRLTCTLQRQRTDCYTYCNDREQTVTPTAMTRNRLTHRPLSQKMPLLSTHLPVKCPFVMSSWSSSLGQNFFSLAQRFTSDSIRSRWRHTSSLCIAMHETNLANVSLNFFSVGVQKQQTITKIYQTYICNNNFQTRNMRLLQINKALARETVTVTSIVHRSRINHPISCSYPMYVSFILVKLL